MKLWEKAASGHTEIFSHPEVPLQISNFEKAPVFAQIVGSESRRFLGALRVALAGRSLLLPPAAIMVCPILRKVVFSLRLDKWLKVSRLIKRRTVANEACDSGRISVSGRPVKASYEVKVGDVLELKFGEKLIRVEVLSTADIVGKDGADAMYRQL